ncbi:MAG TPA: radical SAM protein [Fimbriimonas sp.]
MLEGIHFLLTYRCPYECAHCFLHCGPSARGRFSLARLQRVFEDIKRMPTVKTVFFEGGEPFLEYGLILDGLRMAKEQGLWSGIVTNAFWASSRSEAVHRLRPLAALGLDGLSVSLDGYHGHSERSRNALAAAESLGISCGTIQIDPLTVSPPTTEQGEPVVGGGVMLRGRAAQRLAEGLPRHPSAAFDACRRERLADPRRVHVDGSGNVQVCQGVTIGNCFEVPFPELMSRYDPGADPICGPLLEGGPARLAEVFGIVDPDGYVDECHCCYSVRRRLVDDLPRSLAPRQAYGLGERVPA